MSDEESASLIASGAVKNPLVVNIPEQNSLNLEEELSKVLELYGYVWQSLVSQLSLNFLIDSSVEKMKVKNICNA